MLMEIIRDMKKGIDISVISAKFHNTIVKIIGDTCERIRESENISKVVMSGGIFQNKYILARAENRLKELNFSYYSQKLVPSNDGGIALGQLAILSKKQIEICV
jgi:hydrogenase maturation protein HypF